jgi:hypothetical protein
MLLSLPIRAGTDRSSFCPLFKVCCRSLQISCRSLIVDLPLFRALSQGQNQTGVPADLDPPQNGPPGPNPLANMDRGVQIR